MPLNRFLITRLTLIFVTIVWGGAFVAQRAGMAHVGPFTFNALRFGLGGALVFCLIRIFPSLIEIQPEAAHISPRERFQHALLLGGLLFLGAALQQSGLLFTTAGKAGFLTVLYVVFVPLFALITGHGVKRCEIFGSLIAFTGGYYLSVTESFSISWGDLLVICGAVVWALHVLAVDRAARLERPLMLAYRQFFTCSILSAIAAVMSESPSWTSIFAAWPAILYAGGISIAVGYSLQVIVQRHVSASEAVIIYSLEGVFAALAGWIFLGEVLSERAFFGAVLTVAGVLVAQWPSVIRQSPAGIESSPRP